jgi:2-iminobutanoate/2-iminopropanoate deaminase
MVALQKRIIEAKDAPQANGGYAQALEVSGQTRTLFISGQIPVDTAGFCPPDFTSQARLVWKNIEAQLCAAGMTFDNIVKITIFLSDRKFSDENRQVRTEFLGNRAPALTVIISGIFDESWLLEIEAIAVC